MDNSRDTYLVDGVSAIAIHNGVARLQFMRLGLDGKPVNSHEVHIPMPALKSVLDALRKVQG
ncbi:MAG: hypothetical protein KA045_00040 [Burkholderiaceae bacterium]|jgi:hypothetical protein|nr:hypothetical protein [Burkholderiaceae bacterium]